MRAMTGRLARRPFNRIVDMRLLNYAPGYWSVRSDITDYQVPDALPAGENHRAR